MSSLQKQNRYTFDIFKKDLIAAFSCAAWTFPLVLAFGATSPFGAQAGIIGGIIACLIGVNGKQKISVPNLAIFLIMLYAATDIGINAAMISVLVSGFVMLLISRFNLSRKFLKISPVAVGAVSFAAAIILCIIEVNFYFGIGVPQGTALFTLAAYKSFGFHSNWRGVLFGTITLVIMITYPIKFKKFSKKVPEGFAALLITVLLNVLLLNPDVTHTYIDEIGELPTYLIPSFDNISFKGLSAESILPILTYTVAIVSVYVVETLAKERHHKDINNSLLLKGVNSIISPVFGGLPTSSEKKSCGETKLTNLYSAIIMVAFAFVFHPVLERIPVATLGVIIIVLGWKSPSYKSMKKVFITSKHKFISIVFMFLLIFACAAWNIVYVIDSLAILTPLYCSIRYFLKYKRSK